MNLSKKRIVLKHHNNFMGYTRLGYTTYETLLKEKQSLIYEIVFFEKMPR